MTSPLPGIDPYIEAQGLWSDSYAAFVTYCRDQINQYLPEACVAKIDERYRRVRAPRGFIIEALRETRIEVLRLPEMTLVTVVELLSPSNKTGAGRAEYLEKRLDLIDQ